MCLVHFETYLKAMFVVSATFKWQLILELFFDLFC
jgi:hypothetical protein